MKFYLMLSYCRTPLVRNPVLIRLLDILRQQNVQVDIGVAQDMVMQPGNLASLYDLYILKSHSDLWLSLAGVLHAQGARLLNPYPACQEVMNKIVATQRMQTVGIPAPESWVTGDLNLLLPIAAQKPLIIKPHIGGRGMGVHIVHNPHELSLITPPQEPLVIQEYIEGAEMKLYVIGEQVFGVRKPFSATSYMLAGQPARVSQEAREIALRCGRVFGLGLYGLDIIESVNGPVVVDLNYFPSYKGVPGAARLIADYILNYASGNLAELATNHFTGRDINEKQITVQR
jgi:ribosomal protein S6--L-glutamate ligase